MNLLAANNASIVLYQKYYTAVEKLRSRETTKLPNDTSKLLHSSQNLLDFLRLLTSTKLYLKLQTVSRAALQAKLRCWNK